MKIDLMAFDDTNGLYVVEQTEGRNWYVKVVKRNNSPRCWLVISKESGQIHVCPQKPNAPNNSSGWEQSDVLSVTHHPNMGLKGVPCINTD